MTIKINKPLFFLYTLIASFLLLLLPLCSYLYTQNEKNWIAKLIKTQIFYLPILLYLFIVALSISLLIYLLVLFIHKSQYRNIEEKLQLLAVGKYEDILLSKDIPTFLDETIISNIQHQIIIIKNKLIEMSGELQTVASRPEIVDGQSKEEILIEERHRLARELHDSVSQQLFAAAMMLSAINEQVKQANVDDPVQKQLDMITTIINTAQSEMRALLLHLRPINLEGKSLRQGIEQLLKELQSKVQINIVWEIEDVSLPSGVEDHLFRIVQELLSNTLRHSKASDLEIYLKNIGTTTLLRVVDDGVGFDVSEEKVGSYGLSNIKERVAGLGGTCRIISFKNQGTSIEIRIPIIEGSEPND